MKTLTNNKSLTFKTLIDNFMLASQIEGKAERTLEQYNRVLLPFAKFIKEEPEEVTASQIRDFLAECKAKGWSKSTIWTFHKELSVFFNFCYREGYLSDNPMKLVKKPRMEKLLPRILTEAEISQLLKAAKAKGFIGKRNVALIALLFDSGLRASEISNLKLTDVSLENQVVRVFGKGSKERIIPFSKTTAKLLFSYLRARGNQPFEDNFFLTKQGDKIDRKFLCKLLKKIAVRAGIDKSKVSPHVLRHSFATCWIKAGGDAKRLQHMLGHADPRVVDVYVHLTAKDLSQAHSEFSPLQKLAKL